MGFFIFFIVVFAGFLGGLIYLRRREDRFLRKTVKDTIGKGLRDELEKEAQDAERRKKMWDETSKKFGL